VKNVGVWFRNLSLSGKILSLSVLTLLSFGTIGTFAQSGSPQGDNTPTPSTTPKPSPTPVTTTETKTEAVAFQEETREDGTIAKGQTKVSQEGVNGERTIMYEITTLDGREISRKEIKNEITRIPVNKVTLVGTYIAPTAQKQSSSCDPNYSGACVPIASDVDCAGGSGNGPAYVSGPVYVVGTDIYGLDRDHDGVGCE
jgi:hypothetical protein